MRSTARNSFFKIEVIVCLFGKTAEGKSGVIPVKGCD
jgi:hypothetical protein